MPVYRCDIEPLEPLLFGDHRAARAGVDHLQLDQDPSPLTLHGALGTFILNRTSGWPGDILGDRQDDVLNPDGEMAELLGICYRSADGELLFPRPRHLRLKRSGTGGILPIDLLSPEEITRAYGSSQSALPRLMQSPRGFDLPVIEEVEVPVWLRRERLAEVLLDKTPESDVGFHTEDFIYRPEGRPGIAVDNRSGTVVEGAFFTRPYRRFAPAPLDPEARSLGAGFTTWLKTLAPFEEGADSIGFLGGDRRRARFVWEDEDKTEIDILADLLTSVRQAAEDEETRGFFLYLLTPAIAQEEPFEVDTVPPVAAARGKAEYVSGWNVRGRHPRELHSLVPAGSVFFYRWPEGTSRGDLVRRLWLAGIGKLGGAVGFGRCLVGVWR